jgi:hypothetical protein
MSRSALSVAAVVNTQRGEVIAIMHQYAYTGKGGTIHSSSQLEWCGNNVNDCFIKIDGGRQRLTTPDGYVIPIDVSHGLPYITMCPFTDEEFEELPHVLWRSEDDWDPTSLDSVISDDPSPPLPDPMYDEGGSLREPVLSRSMVQSSRMSLFFNQVNQKTESRPSWD